MKTFTLPYGVVIEVEDDLNGASIAASGLTEALADVMGDDEAAEIIAATVEKFLSALAMGGLDLNHPAVEIAVRSCVNF